MAKKKLSSFQTFNDDESTNYLADHWPIGKLTAKKNVKGSNLYKYLLCLSTLVKVVVGDIFTFAKNRNICDTEELLEEWETSVGIPDQIPRRDTLEGRRRAVRCLYSKIPVYNIENGVVDVETTFEHYIECLTGLEVEIRTSRVTSGKGSDFPQEFPIQFGIDEAYGNFLFIIGVPVEGEEQNNSFPLPFPVSFFPPTIPDATIELLDTILERVIPSYAYWQYEVI